MENNKVTLIDGTFNVAEAKDVLLNMFTMKINFHSQKNVSHIDVIEKLDEGPYFNFFGVALQHNQPTLIRIINEN